MEQHGTKYDYQRTSIQLGRPVRPIPERLPKLSVPLWFSRDQILREAGSGARRRRRNLGILSVTTTRVVRGGTLQNVINFQLENAAN